MKSKALVLALVVAIVAFFAGSYSAKSSSGGSDSAAAAVRSGRDADLITSLRAENGRLTQKNNELSTQVAAKPTAPAAPSAGAPAANDAAAKSAAANAAVEANKAAKAKALVDGQAFLANYPQASDMLMEVGKAQIARNYANFYRVSGISPAQIAELEEKTADHWLQGIAVTPGSVNPSDPELPDDQLRGILGDQIFGQLKDYKRAQPLLGLLNDMSSLSTEEPFTPQQSGQMLTILASASPAYRGGGAASAQTVDWNQVITQAQGVLSDRQMKALKADALLPQTMGLIKQFYQDQPKPEAK